MKIKTLFYFTLHLALTHLDSFYFKSIQVGKLFLLLHCCRTTEGSEAHGFLIFLSRGAPMIINIHQTLVLTKKKKKKNSWLLLKIIILFYPC